MYMYMYMYMYLYVYICIFIYMYINLAFDSNVRQLSHPLMIPYHCIVCGLNRAIKRVVN